jgi:hypothetical protein
MSRLRSTKDKKRRLQKKLHKKGMRGRLTCTLMFADKPLDRLDHSGEADDASVCETVMSFCAPRRDLRGGRSLESSSERERNEAVLPREEGRERVTSSRSRAEKPVPWGRKRDVTGVGGGRDGDSADSGCVDGRGGTSVMTDNWEPAGGRELGAAGSCAFMTGCPECKGRAAAAKAVASKRKPCTVEDEAAVDEINDKGAEERDAVVTVESAAALAAEADVAEE